MLELYAAAFINAAPRQAERLALPALPGASAALSLLSLSKMYPEATILAVTPSQLDAETVHSDCAALTPVNQLQPLMFPIMEESGNSNDVEVSGARLDVLQALTQPAAERQVVIAPVQALQQPVPDPKALQDASLHLQVEHDYDFEATIAKLVENGYERVSEVANKGQLAVRGGLLDIWPPTLPLPARAEFFDTMLESLRSFDPATQISVATCKNVLISPCVEELIPATSFVEMLPAKHIVIWLDHDRLQQYAETNAQENRKLLGWEALIEKTEKRKPLRQFFTGDPPPRQTPTFPLEITALHGLADFGNELNHPDALAHARQRLLADLATQGIDGARVIVCADTAGTCEIIERELGSDKPVKVHHLALSGGFSFPAAKLVVAAQTDLYAVRKRNLRARISPALAARGARLESPGDLEIGTRVVHVDYGIGRYTGTTEIELDGRRVEVFTLEYADGAKLHVPVSAAHLLSRYVGVGDHAAPLHRLGGKRWTTEKAAAERAIMDLAASLLETQAKREVQPGFAFNVEPRWLHEFEASFPYQETTDQLKVIGEIKNDMARSRPMDRLVCGDAGYGKTEVALRAAFIAVMNHKQVAILVPTTVLAEQHFETFRERLAPYPIRVEVLSRFRTQGQRQNTLQALADGSVDIVIGTHALLRPGIVFKDLGLLVIDEEQRFGVRHKEYLKQVRQLVDVLTLTATPIPRTLYLSMTGARDMSLLQTPPRERVATKLQVARDQDSIIRNAIRQELAREGQIFFLYNRVVTIGRMYERLVKLAPEARIAIAHGQMPARELSSIMSAFEAGEYNLLLSTTIVESGLDIPRANTIIIHRADRFGMADLYQLCGRVGRSARKGYAWLLMPEYGHIDDDARKRISALQKNSGLGAGFNLALRDLEIRGGGTLLGASQSGHIAAIGFGLYCQLLKRTVARMKGEKPPLLVDVDLQLDFIELSPGLPNDDSSACLPYAYIEEEGLRMAFHRRIAEAGDITAVKGLRAELKDRFGALPPSVSRLLRLTELRIYAARRKINRIETHGHRAFLYHGNSRQPILINAKIPRFYGATPDQKLAALSKLLNQDADSAVKTKK